MKKLLVVISIASALTVSSVGYAADGAEAIKRFHERHKALMQQQKAEPLQTDTVKKDTLEPEKAQPVSTPTEEPQRST
ncbi:MULTISPECIES: hypothetical protein [unclassified Pseudomonas]|uniref:hypothetical protein n=1 Tax=unclassified Pseudomonas TaxID=196821 RepID=UPI002580C9A7|nr:MULTISPECIES: hypothetical protein [unclassified Pseudomonas]